MSNKDSGFSWLVVFAACATTALLAWVAPPRPATGVALFFGYVAAYSFVVFAWAPAAYRSNWLRHTLAPVTAEGLNRQLLRDFCSSDDLWDSTQAIHNRRLKLLELHVIGAVAHLLVPSGFIVTGLLMFGKTSLEWASIVMLGAAAIGLLFAIAFSSWDAHKVANQQGRTHA